MEIPTFAVSYASRGEGIPKDPRLPRAHLNAQRLTESRIPMGDDVIRQIFE